MPLSKNMESVNEAVILLLLLFYLSLISRVSYRLRSQVHLRRRMWLQRRRRRILAIAFYLSERERATRQPRRLQIPKRAWVWPRNRAISSPVCWEASASLSCKIYFHTISFPGVYKLKYFSEYNSYNISLPLHKHEII